MPTPDNEKGLYKKGVMGKILRPVIKRPPASDPDMEYNMTRKEKAAYNKFMWNHEWKFYRKGLREKLKNGTIKEDQA
jgi:hypothetical protein